MNFLKEKENEGLSFRLGLTFWSDRWFEVNEMTASKTQYVAAMPLTQLDNINDSIIESSFSLVENLYYGGDLPEDVLTAIVFTRTDPSVGWLEDSIKQLHVFTDNPFQYADPNDVAPPGVSSPPMKLWTTQPPNLYGYYDRLKVSAFTLGREWDDTNGEWMSHFRSDWAIEQIFFNLVRCNTNCQRLYDETFNNIPTNLSDWKPQFRSSSQPKSFTRGTIPASSISESFEKLSEAIAEIVEETVSIIEGVDECSNGNHNCHYQANCIDTIDSFTCECKDGWHGDGQKCDDVDECAKGTHGCPDNSRCSNGIGSEFTCLCVDGYQMEGGICVDIDECTAPSPSRRKRRGLFVSNIGNLGDLCPAETSKCINEINGYRCECLPMYRDLSGDGKLCAGPFCDAETMAMENWPDSKITLPDGTECIGGFLILYFINVYIYY